MNAAQDAVMGDSEDRSLVPDRFEQRVRAIQSHKPGRD